MVHGNDLPAPARAELQKLLDATAGALPELRAWLAKRSESEPVERVLATQPRGGVVVVWRVRREQAERVSELVRALNSVDELRRYGLRSATVTDLAVLAVRGNLMGRAGASGEWVAVDVPTRVLNDGYPDAMCVDVLRSGSVLAEFDFVDMDERRMTWPPCSNVQLPDATWCDAYARNPALAPDPVMRFVPAD